MMMIYIFRVILWGREQSRVKQSRVSMKENRMQDNHAESNRE
jgi:hypothetical protein